MIIALQTLIFFRESLLKALDNFLRPYYKHFSLAFNRVNNDDDDESDEQVFADFDDEKGVVFYPPVYAQRYAAVSDCLMDERWNGRIQKVVDLGYHDMSFIKYLKEVPGVTQILGVDIESIPLRCSSDLLGCEETYTAKRESPLQITLYQGNAADPDFRLIGCDAVIGIEMIEHMLPHDLDRLVHTIFGFIRPWIIIFTTPNADFNVLFKALENNGLRRWDHFFEWSREQFNDWCGNIVMRYPDYTVSCKGIGPGPTGTLHYGCCSQMALFVSKDYQKQEDLNINSLSLVANAPSPNNFNEMVGNWEIPDGITEIMLCQPQGVQSVIEFPNSFSVKQSCTTVLSPSSSVPTMDFEDKTSQCNLDTEMGRNFMMFDDEQLFDIMVPRKMITHRVYMIEDIFSRLNCTTYQVKKFSKATQNLMAKNKIDAIVHTREVVDEIRHITKALNFKHDQIEEGEHVWHNINWGENAPYWNQYYRVVRDYNYPFETKSEECRILDLISDEINRLIDSQYDEDFTVDVNRLEIPMEHIMRAVAHITDDMHKVKELMEWNGYEIVEDFVIHSRHVLDDVSAATHEDDWQENETLSDWDTDVHSTSVSDRSIFVTDYNGRLLRRALDQKVRKLRAMMTADKDITTEMDRVLCRLMKLALRSSRGRHSPPPTRWMQCKMLDLLTLTAKAIERRKIHFIETYQLKAIGFEEEQLVDMIALDKIREDDTGTIIVDKYRHLLRLSDITLPTQRTARPEPQYTQLELEDNFESITSNEFKDFEYIDRDTTLPVVITINKDPKEETTYERTQAWVDEDIEMVPYPKHDVHLDNASDTGDTDHSTHDSKQKQNRSKKYKFSSKNTDETNIKVCKKSQSKTSRDKEKIKQDKSKRKSSTRITKNVKRKMSNGVIKNSSNKCVAIEYCNYVVKTNKQSKEHQHVPAASKPIPESIIEICYPKIDSDNIEEFKTASDATDLTNDEITLHQPNNNIAATKESLLIDIIMDGFKETIAMRRTVGTDAENDPMDYENEMIIGSISNELCTKHNVSTENVHSQTIFLNDINEPSTSKGIRHVSMDVQCGPDVTYSALSPSPSLVRMPDMSAIGVKMNTLFADVNVKSTDFGTSTQDGYYETITPRIRSVGIKIRDSDANIVTQVEGSTMTRVPSETQKTVTNADPQVTLVANSIGSSPETKLIKPISSTLKINDSGSDFYDSVESCARSPVLFVFTSKNPSDVLIESSECKEVGVTTKFTKYVRPTLSRGGVHVHSYRDKQVSEDVVYQGEWQRYRPKVTTRRKSYIPTTTRIFLDSALKRKIIKSKEKISLIKLEKKEVKLVPKKPVPTRTLPTRILSTRTLPTRVVPTSVVPTRVVPARNVPKRAIPARKTIINKMNTASKNEIVKPVAPNNATMLSRLPRHIINNVKISSKLTTSSIATRNGKFSHTAKKATPIPSDAVNKDKSQQLKENYIPLYLRKNNQKRTIINKTSLNNSIDTVNTMITVNKTKLIPPLVRSKTQEIEKELLRFSDEPRKNISFVVFRNDKEDKKDTNEQSTHITGSNVIIKPGFMIKRIQSYQSPNSSTCSSPNSVATVRAATAKVKNTSTRRHSSSSYKSSNVNSESDTSSSTKNKKYAKRSKSAKRADCKDICNKENMPESSPKSNLGKENEAYGKTQFVGRHRNIFITQLNTESSHLQFTPNTLSKHQTKPQVSNKSNIKIPVQLDTTEKKRATSPSVSRRRSSKQSTSSTEYKYSKSSPERSNMVLVVERRQPRPVVVKSRNVSPISTDNDVKIVDNNLLIEWMESSSLIGSNSSNIAQSMRQIIEEILEFVYSPFDDIDSETIILSQDDGNDSVEMNASPISFKTVVTNEDDNNNLIESDIEEVLNRTLESMFGGESTISLNDTRQTVTDLDFLSIKSVTSASKYSEYFFADNDMDDSKVFLPVPATNSISVRGIFERKDNNFVQTPTSAIAVQAFSGFSIDGDPVAGDQPDPISMIDSETGSIAQDVGRQATSDELLISGRSSDSFESCAIDEDAVVPNWLFNIISHQQSEVLEPVNSAPQLPMPMPLAEPVFDANGNVVDQGIIGVGAGAGDGRGMHSDHSQDSSGRGTSLSSSEVSSDPQSEESAILIDPSAFTNQFEQLREPLDGAIIEATTSSNSTVDTYMIDENTIGSSNTGRSTRTIRALVVTSDVDADASSNDTDVPDSSDN